MQMTTPRVAGAARTDKKVPGKPVRKKVSARTPIVGTRQRSGSEDKIGSVKITERDTLQED